MSKNKRRKKHSFRHKVPKKMQKKLVLLFVAIVLAFVGLITRIARINAKDGEEYTKRVLNQQGTNGRVIPFKRGDILDRKGTTIATSERVYNVILDASLVLAGKDQNIEKARIAEVKEILKMVFDIEPEAVDKVVAMGEESQYAILKTQIPYEQAQQFEALKEETYVDEKNKKHKKYPYISCIWLEEAYIRYYPYDTLASDVIGFTVSGNVGNGGIEASYNSILNGTDGREYGYLDTDSTLERTVKNAINGKSVVSTIDIALQSIVEKHVIAFNEAHRNEAREGNGSTNTAVIIANPNTGEILAEASYPNYNLNSPRDLTAYFSEEDIAAMSDEERLNQLNKIWRNFCVSDSFEPGSTAKPFTIAAGLENGTLKGDEGYYCNGYLHVGGYDISCHKIEGHGPQNLEDGIANSCNVVMMHVAAAMGYEEFSKYQGLFNFGKETGIDLPGEAAGIVYQTEKFDSSTLATNSFGQNFNVTMTQMVAGFSSLINGGNYYEPHVVKQILDENGNVVENVDPVLLKKTISEETSETLKDYMIKTMTTGTGKNAQVPGYLIGAKTGTAEKHPRKQGNYVLSYMGFAPADDPQVLVYVVIDEPNVAKQDTSKLVTDLSREIMAEAFPYLGIPMVEGTATE